MNFLEKSIKLADERLFCPVVMPYSTAGGRGCCADNVKINDPNVDFRCNGTLLQARDPMSCCQGMKTLCGVTICYSMSDNYSIKLF